MYTDVYYDEHALMDNIDSEMNNETLLELKIIGSRFNSISTNTNVLHDMYHEYKKQQKESKK